MQITIYTITDCPFCKKEKEYLTSLGFTFTEKNLEVNRQFLEEMMVASDKFAGVPFTLITKDDGTSVKLKGFTKEEFDVALGLVTAASVPGDRATPVPTPPPVEPVQINPTPTPPEPTPAPEPVIEEVPETPPPVEVAPAVPQPEPELTPELTPEPVMPTPEPTPSPISEPTPPPAANDDSLKEVLTSLEKLSASDPGSSEAPPPPPPVESGQGEISAANPVAAAVAASTAPSAPTAADLPPISDFVK